MIPPAILLVLIVLGGIVVLLWSNARRRTREFSALAHRLRLKFTVNDTIGLADRLCALHLMHQGHSQRICNIIHGRRCGRRVMLGEARYEIGAGGDRSSRCFTFAACVLSLDSDDGRQFPQMVLFQSDVFRPIGRFQYFLPFRTGHATIDHVWKLYSDLPDAAGKLWKNIPPVVPASDPPMLMEFHVPHVILYVEAPLGSVAAVRLLRKSLQWARYFDSQMS
ncbi:MAG: hypothetical protein JW709_13125 [Sedimentisphaerales bacterium]|nr:hypothetical protein [Sedimentisphaerales bacterium]